MVSKQRILYLEDDPEWIDIISERLARKFEIVSAISLEQAREKLESEDIHLALVDISLIPHDGQDTSGFRFIETMRASELWREIPIVVLTGFDYPERMRKSFKDYGVADFLSKDAVPDEPEALQQLMTMPISASVQARQIPEQPRALIIEDDEEWQEILKEILEDEGCSVDISSDYQDAIHKITSNIYNLATVDIRLSDLDTTDARGFELVELVRRLNWMVDVIFVSGFGTFEQLRKAAFELGAKDFMDKGEFEPQRLRHRIRKILSQVTYLIVEIEAEYDGTPILRSGNKHSLTVSTSRTRPQSGFFRSIMRPVTSGAYEIEVVVYPYDVDVLPGSTQFLQVRANDVAEPVQFEISPAENANSSIELVFDFLYRSNMLARMSIAAMSRS